MNEQLCPLCKTPLNNSGGAIGKGFGYSCETCGDFIIAGSARATLDHYIGDSKTKASIVSHYIRKTQNPEESPLLTTHLLEKILANRSIPTLHEQAANLILWLGKHLEAPGETITLNSVTLRTIIGAASTSGADQVLNHLHASGLIDGRKLEVMNQPLRVDRATLSFEGWERFYELTRGTADSKKAFMAMKFGDPALDKVYKKVFKPAVAQAGFDLQTVLDAPKAGLIDDRIKVDILTSRFLIADLTHDNEGAYWEAGYAEGLGKPVIYTCEKSIWDKQKTHFDTNHYHTVIWDEKEPEEAANLLKATIRATLPGEAKMTDE